MADVVFNVFLEAAIDDYIAAANQLQITLLMSSSELESAQSTARDRATLAAIEAGGGLDEYNGASFTNGYAGTVRKDVTLTGEVDNTNDLGSMESVTGTYTWSSMLAGSRSITGVLFFDKGSSDDTTSLPICYYQFAAPRPADGNNFVVNFNVGGGEFIKLAQGS